jgi:hypothetical protein
MLEEQFGQLPLSKGAWVFLHLRIKHISDTCKVTDTHLNQSDYPQSRQ